ncbi:hypothetical protein V6N00_11215 [Tersicoccus sp. MR15.9]|uniref:arsenate reductase/protein-tyrosine-phosphatase family protein n=1 Tax=Tersicoccus mangrovi TaxID=3121635 RepID=UPI002FE5BC6D
MARTLLVVCTANVCRSRYAEAVITSLGAGDWSVVSAGVRSGDDLTVCSRVAERLSGSPQERVAAGAATTLREAHVLAADLILTAERAHRSAVNRLVPEARARTFTLREFVDLVDQFGWTDPTDVVGSLADLDRARPRLVIRVPVVDPLQRMRARHAGPGSLLDIDDGHEAGRWKHARVLDEIESVSAAVASILSTVPDEAPPHGPSPASSRGRHRDGPRGRWHNRRSRG